MSHADDFDDDYPSIARPPESRDMAIWTHWLGFLTGFVVPLVLLVMERNRRSLVAWHVRESLNFQITLMLYYCVPTFVCCLGLVDFWYLLAGLVMGALLVLFELTFVTLASLAGANGVRYRYPLTIPFIAHPDPRHEFKDHDDRE